MPERFQSERRVKGPEVKRVVDESSIGMTASFGGDPVSFGKGPETGTTGAFMTPVESTSIAGEVSQQTFRPRRVLLVDDNADIAELMADALSERGHVPLVAYDGPQALKALDSFDAEVALLDLGLPVMDGYELARHIRERSAGQGIRLVAVTGYGQDKDRELSAKAGFALHMLKPVDVDRLCDALERLFENEPGSL